MKKSYFKKLPLILLAAAIALSPSFPAGQLEDGKIIEIRAEDILLAVLGLVWLANFLISGKEKGEKPPLFFPILAWLAIGLFSVLTNWIFMHIALWRGFFYFLKEVEFLFLYFYLFYHLKRFNSIKFFLKIWIFLGLVNIVWIVYELISGARITYHYGPTAIMEPEGTLSSGGFFLILFIFLFNIFLFHYLGLKISRFNKTVLLAIIGSLALGVVTSGSRAAFVGLIFSLLLTFFLYSIKKRFFAAYLGGCAAAFLIFLIFTLSYHNLFFEPGAKIFSSKIMRLLDIKGFLWEFTSGDPLSRVGVWKTQLSEAAKHPLFLFFGMGKSVILVYGESHSQYLRNFIETGILGSFAFFFLFFIIIKKSWRGFAKKNTPLLNGLSSGLLVATSTMFLIGITAEVFILVKIAEVYWFFAALTMTALYFYKRQKEKICVV